MTGCLKNKNINKCSTGRRIENVCVLCMGDGEGNRVFASTTSIALVTSTSTVVVSII